MQETTVDDPVFGRLVWDGFQHEGWGGSFVDAQYLSWGGAIAAVLPDDDDEEPPVQKSSIGGFLTEMLSIAGAELERDPKARGMIQAARDFARRVDAYDGSLDPAPLRKAGRSKLVVRNVRDKPPTSAQQAAWNDFRNGGDSMSEQIASALLTTYRQQRPERLRWWKIVYGDSPDGTLPDVTTPQGMRALVRPKEFRVYGEQNGVATIAVVFESFWCDKDIEVSLRAGQISVGPVESTRGISTAPPPVQIESPVFGRLQRDRVMHGWNGVFHSDGLRGYDMASQMRHRFKENPSPYRLWRPGPSWDAITGDFDLHIHCDEGQFPSPEQEAAFQKFYRNPGATAHLVLSAILAWYQEMRPDLIKIMNGSPELLASVMPDLRSPEQLLEIIQLQSIMVLSVPTAEEIAGTREVPVGFGEKYTLPARKTSVGIALLFHWEDEHGLGARWRDGNVEQVGDWESVADEYG